MADKSVIFTLIAKDSASAAIKGVEGSMHGLKGAAGGLGGVLGSVGGALTSLPALIGGAGVTAAIIGMTKAAADDEAAQKRLLTAVQANVPGWNGQSDAIDAAIKKSQALGFTDDDVRDSLTRLVTSTHDVKEATDLNAAAMDLARLKGISLADAANIIGKAHDGSFEALKRYGIVLAEGATATDALAAIQAASQGQAQAYGDTTAGGMDKLGIAVGELGEQVGTLFLPVMQGAVSLLNDTLLPAVSSLVSGLGSGGGLGGVFGDLGPAVQGLITKFGEWWTVISTQIIPTLLDLVTRVWNGGLKDAFSIFAELAGRVYGALSDIFTTVLSNKDVLNILQVAAGLVGGAFKLVAEWVKGTFDILGTLFTAITTNKPLMDGLEAVVKGIWTGLQQVVGFATDVVTWFGQLFSGIASNKDVMDVFRGVVDAIASGFKAAFDAITGFWGVLQQVWDFVQHNPVTDVLGGIGDVLGGRATGGYVASGTPYIVGENGPELFVPSVAGRVVPSQNVGSALGGSAAGSVNVSVSVSGPAVFDPLGVGAQQLAAALIPGLRRELARTGGNL